MFYCSISNSKGNIEYASSHDRKIDSNTVDIELNKIYNFMEKSFERYVSKIKNPFEHQEIVFDYDKHFKIYCEKFKVEFSIGNLTKFIGNGRDFLTVLNIANPVEILDNICIEECDRIVGEQETDFQEMLVNDKFNPTY